MPFEPIPYSFGYAIKDVHGEQHRQEKSDGAGVVTGSYGFVDEHGIHRQVHYIADHLGFRAKIITNEPVRPPRFAVGNTGQCAAELVVPTRWCNSTLFDCDVKQYLCYIFREVDWRTFCVASTFPGPQFLGFLLLRSPESTCA
ncbi:cuticle protein 10.9 [Trichonephila clavipes]|nr:cuticle protein 10.9 [Trichonephila clavipes]